MDRNKWDHCITATEKSRTRYHTRKAVVSGTNGLQHIPDDGLLSLGLITQMHTQDQYVMPAMEIFRRAHTDPKIIVNMRVSSMINTNTTYANVLASTNGLGFSPAEALRALRACRSRYTGCGTGARFARALGPIGLAKWRFLGGYQECEGYRKGLDRRRGVRRCWKGVRGVKSLDIWSKL
ncbi:hypothetical protein F5X99DRAFT_407357 [Biscogniauxia marginata]|nr:hypothetical protein F5X99DRAFT_407357 [Biscogniauxia marginata]